MCLQTAPIQFYIRLHLQGVTLVHAEPPELRDLINVNTDYGHFSPDTPRQQKYRLTETAQNSVVHVVKRLACSAFGIWVNVIWFGRRAGALHLT